MANHTQNMLAWLERMRKYREARDEQGYKHPEAAKLYETQACSGLPSASKGFEDAENLLARENIADLLNPRNKAVIPPPPAGEDYIVLGYDEAGNPVWVKVSELCLGTIAVAAPGSGKTHLLSAIIQNLKQDVIIHAGDSKKELYRILKKTSRKFLYVKPSALFVGIFECPISDPVAYYPGLIEFLARYLGIDDSTWPEVAAMLIQIRLALPKNEPMPSVTDFVAHLRRIGTVRRKGKFHTAAAKFLVLAVAYGETAGVRRGPDLHSRYSAIGIDYTGVAHTIRHATDFIINYQYIEVLSERGHSIGKLRLFNPADEGLDTWGRSFSTAESAGRVSFQDVLSAQGRSYGVGRFVSLQFIRQGMDSAFCNSGIIIIMRLTDPYEAVLGTRYLNIPEKMAPIIQNLQPREAFIKTPSYPAVRMTVSQNILDAYPSENEINSMMAPEIEWMRRNSIMSPLSLTKGLCEIDYIDLLNSSSGKSPEISADTEKPVTCQPKPIARQLFAEWRAFLREVIEHPDVGICAHYKALGLSGSRGVRIKAELIEAGLLIEQTLTSKTHRPITKLIVTELGLQSLEANHQ